MTTTEWDHWYTPKTLHQGCQIRIKREIDGDWIHVLLSPQDEPDPRGNHIHVKYYKKLKGTPVLCGITDNGRKSHSRRQLLEKINTITGLNISYK